MKSRPCQDMYVVWKDWMVKLLKETDLKILKMVLQTWIGCTVHFVHQLGIRVPFRRIKTYVSKAFRLYMYHLGDGQRDTALFPHFHTFWALIGKACSLANEVLTNYETFLLLPVNTNTLLS